LFVNHPHLNYNILKGRGLMSNLEIFNEILVKLNTNLRSLRNFFGGMKIEKVALKSKVVFHFQLSIVLYETYTTTLFSIDCPYNSSDYKIRIYENEVFKLNLVNRDVISEDELLDFFSRFSEVDFLEGLVKSIKLSDQYQEHVNIVLEYESDPYGEYSDDYDFDDFE
jgi:hypothetical protein